MLADALATDMEKGSLRASSLLLLGVLSSTLPRLLDIGTGLWFTDPSSYSEIGKKGYYVGQAAIILFFLLAVKTWKENKWNRRIYRITMALTVSNLLDELFFDPLHLGINEVVFAVVVIIYEIFIHKTNESNQSTI